MTRCVTCKYSAPFISDEAIPGMECHRYPPVMLVNDEGVLVTLLPQVFEVDWCGEWAR